jgi:hypothetical protein
VSWLGSVETLIIISVSSEAGLLAQLAEIIFRRTGVSQNAAVPLEKRRSAVRKLSRGERKWQVMELSK